MSGVRVEEAAEWCGVSGQPGESGKLNLCGPSARGMVGADWPAAGFSPGAQSATAAGGEILPTPRHPLHSGGGLVATSSPGLQGRHTRDIYGLGATILAPSCSPRLGLHSDATCSAHRRVFLYEYSFASAGPPGALGPAWPRQICHRNRANPGKP